MQSQSKQLEQPRKLVEWSEQSTTGKLHQEHLREELRHQPNRRREVRTPDNSNQLPLKRETIFLSIENILIT